MIQCLGEENSTITHQGLNWDLSTGGQKKFHNKNNHKNKIPKKVIFRLQRTCQNSRVKKRGEIL